MSKKTNTEDAPKKKKRPVRTILIILLIIVLVIALVWLVFLAVNYGMNLSLRKYIRSFDPVDYSGVERVLPTEDKDSGRITFVTDEELNIMVLSDIHMGGGCWHHDDDLKTIYEIITMLQKVKPDLVVLTGDNVFAVPGPVYDGGGTFNNRMVAKTLIKLFEHEGVYFTTVFGNHDTEFFDYTGRQALSELYEKPKYKYSLFRQEFTDPDAGMPSVTNQIIEIRNSKGKLVKSLVMLDTNSYVDKSIRAVLDWTYDTVHDAQINWLKAYSQDVKKENSFAGNGSKKAMFFFHIPIGEYEVAYRDLTANGYKNTNDTEYVSGVWDEEIDAEKNIRIYYGGCNTYKENPQDADLFFETLGPEGQDFIDACVCGHDHTNNAVVRYKGVTLAYAYSMDNIAYEDINRSGLQRGCLTIKIKQNGSCVFEHLNAYNDLGVSTDKYVEVYTDHYYKDGYVPE